MGVSLDSAAELLSTLTTNGVNAVLDPRDVTAGTPVVLIGPPRWDVATYAGVSFTWRLLAIAGTELPNLDAWAELDELVTAVVELLPVELAEPAQYQPPSGPGRPAYALTVTGS